MRKLNVTILVGVIVAVLGFALVFAYGASVDNKIADGKRTQKVLVAKQLLSSGSTPQQITDTTEVKEVPQAYLASGSLATFDSVKGLVLLGPVGTGQQLTQAMFGQPLDAGAVKPSVGHVAVAVTVELSPGVARYVTPGSSVDVFVTYKTAAGGTGTDGPAPVRDDKYTSNQRTKLFLSNIKVLSVTVAEPTVGADQKSTVDNTQQASNQVVAVLDVRPQEGERLVNAADLGDLYLGLNSLDGKGEDHKTPTGVVPDDVVVSNR